MLELGQNGEIFVGLVLTGLLKHCISRWMRERRGKSFERVGTVSKLLYYPVKSCQAMELMQGDITPLGLQYNGITDRHWMVIRPNNHFLSLRQNSTMAFIKVTDTGDAIQLEVPGKQPIRVSKQVQQFSRSQVKTLSVHGQPVEGVDCGEEVASWLSDYLQTDGLRLVVYSPTLQGKDIAFSSKPWPTSAVSGDISAYSDWSPYMVMTDASLDALNERLSKPVTFRSFRPNILVAGTQPFEEDEWEEIRIGDKVQMRCLDPCTRCVLTTVDPDLGQRSPNGEPLETLKKFRCFPEFGPSPCFGVDTAADVFGKVKVGDPVYAIKKQKK